MNIDEDGLTVQTTESRISEILSTMSTLFPRVDVSPASYLYQVAKIVALREMTWQELLLDYFDQLSPMTASGIWLDAHALRAGLARLGATKSNAITWATGVQVGTTIATTNSFYTDSGVYFSPVRDMDVPIVFEVVHAGDEDDVTDGYEFSSIEKITTDAGGSVEYTGYTFDSTNQVIDWSDAASPPAEGHTYHVWPGTKVNVKVTCKSDEKGTSNNVSANTITSFSGITADSCTNRSAATGGTDLESDSDLRDRYLAHVFAKTSMTDLEDDIIALDNVDDAKVSEVLAVDHADPASWDTVPGEYMHLEWDTIEEEFSPGTNIGIINSISLAAATTTSNPDPLEISLKLQTSALATTNLSADKLEPGHGTGFQEVKIPIRYAPVDNTLTYTLSIYGTNYTGGRGWELSFSGNSGEIDADGTTHPSSLALKTWYKTNAVKVVIDTDDYTDVESGVEELMEAGHVFPGTDWAISQANLTYFSFTIVVDKQLGHADSDLQDNIESAVETYLLGLGPGDTIHYSKLVSVVMAVAGVVATRSVTISKDGVEVATRDDEYDVTIGDDEAPRLNNVVVRIGNVQ